MALKFPEHDKLRTIKDKSQTIGEFLEWCEGQSFELCEVTPSGNRWPITERREAILARFFEIDLDVLEREKRAMLKSVRKANGIPTEDGDD
jgi:hypothetical protein